MLKAEKRISHNYSNIKVAKWMVENHVPFDKENGLYSFGCSCQTYTKNDRGPEFIQLEDGTEKAYEHFFDRYDAENLIAVIPGLSDDEKEELQEIEQLWIYYCPFCHEWAMDGANI